jgi:hypothetical protein
MAYCISEVRHKEFPDAGAVAGALKTLGLSLDEVLAAFRGYICPLTPTAGRGYRTDLAEDLKGYLEKTLHRDGLRPTRARHDLAYSRTLDEHAEFGLVHESSNRRVFFEMEFRPSLEKDLIRFQVGASEGILAAAVMVLSIDPKSIDAAFTTMPTYEAATKVVEALRPSYPLILIGLRGAHAA